MRVVVSEPARSEIAARGGRLYVRLKRGRCCGRPTTLVTASEPAAGVEFRRVDGAHGFDLFVPAQLGRLPDELHVDLVRRRVEAYWDGCAWVV
ncbi:MAG TPA: hypothetical protein VEH55_00735 [Gaiellaceae bacterium]|jgi:hypothetical protein|nr:hypothetical protein [Gaiellaceae bacterium]